MFLRLLSAYRENKSGNFSIFMALCLFLLIAAAGAAVDTKGAHNLKSKFQSYSDAAVLAAARTGSTDKAVLQAEAEAIAIANNTDNLKFTTKLKKVDNDTIRVTITGSYNTYFMGLIGKSTTKVEALAESKIASAAPKAPHINIHFIVDDSMSMGIGQTAADQRNMVYDNGTWSTNQEPCSVACHLPPGGVPASWNRSKTILSTYDYYKSKGIRLRIDAVKDAMISFITNLQNDQAKSAQTKVSITALTEFQNNDAFAFNNSFRDAINEARAMTLATGNAYPYGLTELGDELFETISQKIGNVGDGSNANSPLVYVILMTDGLEHFESSSSLSEASDDSFRDPRAPRQFIQNMNPDVCQVVKSTNATLMIMNVEYLFPAEMYVQRVGGVWRNRPEPWQNLAAYPNYAKDYQRYVTVSDLVPRTQAALEACSSASTTTPGTKHVYKVDQETEMAAAFDSMYETIMRGKDIEVALTR